MSIFETIDSQLLQLSNRLNATFSKDRPKLPSVLRTFEERRIDWIDNGVYKAIIIQPTFEVSGVNSQFWNFTILAWYDEGEIMFKWLDRIVKKEKFDVIENNIDELLRMSEDTLTKITKGEIKQD